MKPSYKLKKEIEQKLFHGIIMPTANAEGYTLKDSNKIVHMMVKLCEKYHAMTKEDRKLLISKAEKNIEDTLSKLSTKE